MKGEYLLFNLLILAGPLALSFWRRTPFVHRFGAVALAVLLASTPYIIWDALVTERHWWFNPAYTLDWRPLGLPPGEWAFFVTVPFACAFSWEHLIKPTRGRQIARRRWLYLPLFALAPVGLWCVSQGLEYTGLTLVALAFAAVVDALSGVRLLTHSRYPLFVLLLLAQVLLFNGYLTARPVVLYDARYQLDLRVFTIPIEDFGYGLSLMHLSLVFFELGKRFPMLSQLIERRFGGYRHPLNDVDTTLPTHLDQRDPSAVNTTRPTGTPRVAVVGGGIAGLCAASQLAERGLAVTLFEANGHLGGKLGSWTQEVDGLGPMRVEHGFHAFFRHYYNWNRFLDRLEIRERFRPVEDYTILDGEGRRFGFANLHRTPALNLVSLIGSGMLAPRDLLRPQMKNMRVMLEYDEDETFAQHDGTSFAEFSARTKLPAQLQLVFNSFSRAFFAEPEDMSLAELIKSFHFYFLSHDYGLIYDIPEDDHEHTVLAPIRQHLERHRVRLRLGAPVSSMTLPTAGDEADGFEVNGEHFDHVVVACDVQATRRLLTQSPRLRDALPRTAAALARHQPSARYAVLRLWCDRDTNRQLPGFVIVDRARALDSISLYHRVEAESAQWAALHDGGVYELHSYSVPEDLDDEDEVRGAMLEDFYAYFPELDGCRVLGEHFEIKRDFTAFAPGLHASRPGVVTEVEGLYLAGDWVRLPCPAMLMEAAATSGMLAANEILAREGLRTEQLYTVPRRGLLATAK